MGGGSRQSERVWLTQRIQLMHGWGLESRNGGEDGAVSIVAGNGVV